jgi:hypothetical protein
VLRVGAALTKGEWKKAFLQTVLRVGVALTYGSAESGSSPYLRAFLRVGAALPGGIAESGRISYLGALARVGAALTLRVVLRMREWKKAFLQTVLIVGAALTCGHF